MEGGQLSEADDFREILARQAEAEEAIVYGVTHVYRREDGEWKIVHRHGDLAPADESPPAGRLTE